MFSLSFWEVFFIFAVAVIVLKPEDIPAIAKQVGKFIAKVKNYFSDFTDLFDDSGKAKTKTLIADDGLEYEAYDVDEIMKDAKSEKPKKKVKKKVAKKPQTKRKQADKTSGKKKQK